MTFRNTITQITSTLYYRYKKCMSARLVFFTPDFDNHSYEPPTIRHGLRLENGASQVVENGTWGVRNSAGEMTAMWDNTTQEWVYNKKTIHIQYEIIGNYSDDPSVYDEVLARPIQPSEPSYFIDPDTNEPMEYGSRREGIVSRVFWRTPDSWRTAS
jgi:hypothetical protein